MATVTVYPPYRALVGTSHLVLDLPPGTPLRLVLAHLGARYPALREFASAPSNEFLWGQLIVHVNEEIAGLDTPVNPDDHLDLLPPIAGGATGPRPASAGRRPAPAERRGTRRGLHPRQSDLSGGHSPCDASAGRTRRIREHGALRALRPTSAEPGPVHP